MPKSVTKRLMYPAIIKKLVFKPPHWLFRTIWNRMAFAEVLFNGHRLWPAIPLTTLTLEQWRERKTSHLCLWLFGCQSPHLLHKNVPCRGMQFNISYTVGIDHVGAWNKKNHVHMCYCLVLKFCACGCVRNSKSCFTLFCVCVCVCVCIDWTRSKCW
jgi:hypothetical protein